MDLTEAVLDRNGCPIHYWTGGKADAPLVANYLCSAAAGVLWYLQFVTLTIGKNYMGKYAFNSWALLMSSMIIFSTAWAIVLAEWRGCSARTKALLAAGLAILVASVGIIGYSNYLANLADMAEKVRQALGATP